MFDFLTEKKRYYILNHPELGKPFISGNTIINKKLLVENIKAFAPSICSVEQPENIRFTDKEIIKIIEEIENPQVTHAQVNNTELRGIADRILKEAGFEIFHHAGEREDLNDWHGKESYIRCVHNMRMDSDFTKYKEIIKENKESGLPFGDKKFEIYSTCIDFSLVANLIPGISQQIQVPKLSNVKIDQLELYTRFIDTGGQISHAEFGIFNNVSSMNVPDEQPNKFVGRKHFMPNFIRCWLLIEPKEIKKTPIGTRPVKIEIKRKGLLGYFGFKKMVTMPETIYKTERVITRNTKVLLLKEIITTHDASIAYLMEFVIQADVPEGMRSKRRGMYPRMRIILSKKMAEIVLVYLLQNPEQYNELIKEILRNGNYKNSLNIFQTQLPTKGIIVENYTSGYKFTAA